MDFFIVLTDKILDVNQKIFINNFQIKIPVK